jgi:hypothetical protein
MGSRTEGVRARGERVGIADRRGSGTRRTRWDRRPGDLGYEGIASGSRTGRLRTRGNRVRIADRPTSGTRESRPDRAPADFDCGGHAIASCPDALGQREHAIGSCPDVLGQRGYAIGSGGAVKFPRTSVDLGRSGRIDVARLTFFGENAGEPPEKGHGCDARCVADGTSELQARRQVSPWIRTS